MIAQKNIESLLSQWRERLTKNYSDNYKCALGECLYDLENILEQIKKEEEANLQEVLANLPSKEAEEYILEQEADAYLSSIEAHIA